MPAACTCRFIPEYFVHYYPLHSNTQTFQFELKFCPMHEAAPEMLAALKSQVEACLSCGGGGETCEIESCQSTRALIAKAEGRNA